MKTQMFEFDGMKLGMVPVDQIVTTRANYKKMTPEQFAALRRSVDEFGWRSFAVVRDLGDGTYEMIDGHHRLQLAKERGMEALPCVMLDEGADLSALARISFNVQGEVLPDVMLDMLRELETTFGAAEVASFSALSENFIAGALAMADEVVASSAKTAPPPVEAPAGPAVAPPWSVAVQLPAEYAERMKKMRRKLKLKTDEELVRLALDKLLGD